MRLPSQPYLCHLHSNTFGEIPLDVLQVNLCCAACNVTQLQSKTFWSIFKQMKTETKRATVRLSWFKRYLITQRTQPPPLDPHLNTSVVGPHLILDPVFFKDVNWLQKCEPLYVPFRFIPGRVENHKKKKKKKWELEHKVNATRLNLLNWTHTLSILRPSPFAAVVTKNS